MKESQAVEMTASAAGEFETSSQRRIGLIAGNGQFPILFSRVAGRRGFDVFAVAYLKEADEELNALVSEVEWIHVGQVRKLIRFFRKHRIREAVMLGGIKKSRLFSDLRPDTKALSLIAGMIHTHDDGVLRAFATLLEKEGIQIRPSTLFLPDLLAPKGCWTRRKPSRKEKKDIAIGWKIAKEIGRLDVGQCVVVGGGSVLAVEAIDGTDETIRRGGRLGDGAAVVVKVCKPIQDTRFDMPAIGMDTIRTMIDAEAKVLVVEAGKSVAFNKNEMVELADRHGIAIVALEDDVPVDPS